MKIKSPFRSAKLDEALNQQALLLVLHCATFPLFKAHLQKIAKYIVSLNSLYLNNGCYLHYFRMNRLMHCTAPELMLDIRISNHCIVFLIHFRVF